MSAIPVLCEWIYPLKDRFREHLEFGDKKRKDEPVKKTEMRWFPGISMGDAQRLCLQGWPEERHAPCREGGKPR